MLGAAVVFIWFSLLSWIYFSTAAQWEKLLVDKSIEVLGRDTVLHARAKGINLDRLEQKLNEMYPDRPVRRFFD